MQLSPGDRIGPYEVLSHLGAGGMGSVYRARDLKLGREIAVKILQERLLGTAEYLKRFLHEARSASGLNHPNIITIYEIGDHAGSPYIAMELVDGRPLRDLLKDGPVPTRKLLHIASQIAEGLTAAHERGIVHRDLKPENVMITSEGVVKILDFGLARLREPAGHDASTSELITPATREGAVIGTAGYMSPEQASGGAVDFRSDQFSFGSILYEMATGKRAFRRSSALDTLSAIVHDDPEPLSAAAPRVPAPLRWTIQRCLAKDPKERYAATRDLAHELATLRDHAAETTSDEIPKATRFSAPRKRALALASLAAAAVVVAVLIPRSRVNAVAEGRQQQLPERIYLAILPFADLRGASAEATNLFARGFTEVVSTQLKKKAGDKLFVIAPTAVTEALERKLTPAQLARALHANLLLEGSILQEGSQLRVNFSVRDPRGIQHAGDTLTARTNQAFPLQYEVADSVLLALGLTPAPRSGRETGIAREENQIAYLEALAHMQHSQDEGEIDTAIAKLEELAGRAPEAALVQAALGRAYLHKYNLTQDRSWADKAITASERAGRIDSTFPEVHQTIAETHLLTGKFEEAIREFRTALADQPYSADATLGLAKALQEIGDYDNAEKTFRRAIELHPSWVAYFEFGHFYRSRADYRNASRMFSEVVRIYPDHPWGYARLGGTQLLMGDFDVAQRTLTRAIQIEPENHRAHNNLGTTYYYLGRLREAVQEYRKALEYRPNDSLYRSNLADAYSALKMKTEAREEYDRAIALATEEVAVNPQDVLANAILAKSYARTGKFDLARKHARIALEQEPERPDWIVQAAMVANMSGNQREAVELLQRALSKNYPRAFIDGEPVFANVKHLLGATTTAG